MTSMTEAKPPTVSIAMPTYKGELFIRAAIESVLQQSFRDFELIISDDNSPDGTQAIVESFDDRRIIYIRQAKNIGPEGNWNFCLGRARGKYFKLLPHDDLMRADCLSRQVAVLDGDIAEKIALVFSAREVIGPDGQTIMQRGYPNAMTGEISAGRVVRTCARRGTNLIGEPGAVMFRKSLADKVGKFDGVSPYVIDLDYWLRLLDFGSSWFDVEPLACFRVSKQQWSVALGKSQNKDFIDLMKRAKRRFLIGNIDLVISYFTSFINNILRLLFYKIYLK